ncbi:MAG: WG repeat-containing protein [Cytophagales bacterium]|nr:MAG: WG repeat-containing protein [Cytophagales bacterium]TAF62276.1 MAG: WG repeat-containing protein [Cytophagales bacterium]
MRLLSCCLSLFTCLFVHSSLWANLVPFMARDESYQGLWGYQEQNTGRVVVMPQYQTADHFSEGLARVSFFGKYGFINNQGKIQIPLIYDELHAFKDGVASAKMNGKAGLINNQNQIILPLEYDQVQTSSQKMVRVRQNRRYGYANLNGQIVIPVIYEMASPFSIFGLALVQKDGLYGFLNLKGDVAIPFLYDDATEFDDNGLATVRLETRYGCLNKQGIAVVPIIYEEMIHFVGQTAVVRRNGKYGLIDVSGKEILTTSYEAVKPLSEQKIAVKNQGHWRFLDTNGKELFALSPETEVYETFQNGIAKIFKKNLFGLVNAAGSIVQEPVHNEISEFKNGFCIVKREKKYGLLNANGTMLSAPVYDDMWRSERTTGVYMRKGRLVGAMTAEGKIVAEPIYDNCEFLSTQPLALAVQKGSHWGLCNAEGKLLLPLVYDHISALENNLILLNKNNLMGCANMQGKVLIPPQYHRLDAYSNDILAFVKNGAYSVFSTLGKKILLNTYENLFLATAEGHFWLKENGLYALFSPQGKALTGFEYSEGGHDNKGLISCKKNKQSFLLDKNGQIKFTFDKSLTGHYEGTLLGFKSENSRIGYINWQNQVQLNAEYSQALPFSEGLAAVQNGDFWGMIDTLGQLVLPFEYEQILPCIGNRIWLKKPRQEWVCQTPSGEPIRLDRFVSDVFFDLQTPFLWSKDEKTGRFGLVSEGVKVHPHIFEAVSAMMASNRLFVKLLGKWQYINSQNKIIFTNYDEVDYGISNNLYIKRIRQNNRYAYFDCRQEKLLTEFVFDNAGSFEFTFLGSDGLVGYADVESGYTKVMRNGKWAIMDYKARLVTEFAFEDIELFSNGLAKVKYKEKYGFINNKADVVIPFLYDEASSFKNGAAFVKINKFWGVINKEGKILVEPLYDDVISTNVPSVVHVTKNGLYGFIHLKNPKAPTVFYDAISSVFVGGLLEVENNGLKGFINTQIQEVIEPVYERVGYSEESLIAAKKDNLWGFIDKSGQIVIPFQYDYAESFNHLGQAPVKLRGDQFFINLNGEKEAPKSGWLDTDIFDANDEDW